MLDQAVATALGATGPAATPNPKAKDGSVVCGALLPKTPAPAPGGAPVGAAARSSPPIVATPTGEERGSPVGAGEEARPAVEPAGADPEAVVKRELAASSTSGPVPRASPGILPWLVAGLSLLALAPAWALYRRIRRERVLANPTRRRVLDLVLADPGLTTHAAARALGVDRRTARHHLDVLREFGHLTAQRIGARERWYENGGTYSRAEQATLAALRPEAARRVASAVAASPAASLAELARLARMPKSTVRYHLARLRAAGAVPAPAAQMQPLSSQRA